MSSTITKKGQITIPADIRSKYNLVGGKKVIFVVTKDGILIKPVTTEIRKLRGILDSDFDLEKAKKVRQSLQEEWKL